MQRWREFAISWITAVFFALQSISAPQSPARVDLAAPCNAFACDLYSRLSKQPGNLIISPVSIAVALAMTCEGARGETAREMASVLNISEDAESLHAYYGALAKGLSASSTSGSEIISANALFAQSGYPFLKPFQERLRDTYNATFNEVDMAQAAATRKRINDWVSEMTHNKILDIIPPSIPGRDTRLILVNAVWFKAAWAMPFDKASTTNFPFRLNSGETVPVPMMAKIDNFRYAKDKLMQVLELPYSSNQFSMMIFLPKGNTNFALVERSLNPVRIEQWRRKCEKQEVSIGIPRFKAGSQFDLIPALKERGMNLAFTEAADFSGITPKKPFFILNVLHKACIDVDEAGTEAAASTAVAMDLGIPELFLADHPFLFLISDNRTGTILFIGRVTDPSTSSN